MDKSKVKEPAEEYMNVSVKLRSDICKKIDEIAAKEEWPRAVWIRAAIKEKLERDEEVGKDLFNR